MLKSIIISAALILSSSAIFAQTTLGVVADPKEAPGLKQVEQPDGQQAYCLFNPDAMSQGAIAKAIGELEEEIEFLEGQLESMKKCGTCFEELEASIKRNRGLLTELTTRKN